MWDSLLVPRAVKIQKENGPNMVKKVLIEHFLKIRKKTF